MGQLKRFFGLFLFTALLFIKVSALHSYSHNDVDDIQDCETCVLALENQQENFHLNISNEFPTSSQQEFDTYVNTYNSVALETITSGFLFGRPPPTA
jgi:archaellum component FlaF (FlaF/FlaG flagellin family)